jgi:hypothetical protein
MSSRHSKKAALTPGKVIGRSPEQLLVSSPQRKIGSEKGKRFAPQAKPLNAAAASFVAGAAAFHPGTGSSEPQTHYSSRSYADAVRSAPGSSFFHSKKKGVCVDESKNKVMDLPIDDDKDWEELDTSEEGQGEHIGEVDAAIPSSHCTEPKLASDDGCSGYDVSASASGIATTSPDSMDEAADDASATSSGSSSDGGVASSAKPRSRAGDSNGNRSLGMATAASFTAGSPNLAADDASKSSWESDDEPDVMYSDLSCFAGSIWYKHDASKDFWFADYSNLSVKEMRELLKARGQGSSGAAKEHH